MASRGVGVDGGHRALVAGVHGLEHVEGLGGTALADDDAVGAHAEGVLDEVADRHLPGALGGRGPGLEVDDVGLLELELGGVLDGDDPLAVGDEGGQHVEVGRLAGAGTAGHEDVELPRTQASTGDEVEGPGAEVDEVLGGVRVLGELPDREHGAVQGQRRDDGVHAGAVGQAGVDHRRGLVRRPDRRHDLVDHGAVLDVVGEGEVGVLDEAAALHPDVVVGVAHHLGDGVVGEQGSRGPYPRVSDIISWTKRRRSSGVTSTSSRWRICRGRSSPRRPAPRPRGPASWPRPPRGRARAPSSWWRPTCSWCGGVKRLRFCTPAAGGGGGAGSAASRLSSSSRAASFSDSFIGCLLGARPWACGGTAGLLGRGVGVDACLEVRGQDELHAAGHQAADLGGGGGGHHGHAEVDGPAHLLGVGEHGLEALREELGDLLDVDADVALGLVEEAHVVGGHLQALERAEEHAHVADARKVERAHHVEHVGEVEARRAPSRRAPAACRRSRSRSGCAPPRGCG